MMDPFENRETLLRSKSETENSVKKETKEVRKRELKKNNFEKKGNSGQ